jgi:cytochrome c oxidase subunit IV
MEQVSSVEVKPVNKEKIRHFFKVTLYLFVITVFEFAIAFTVPHDYKWLRIIVFIMLTIVKAYYIMAEFMHLGHERKSLKMTILLPLLFVVFLIFVMLFQSDAIYKILY